MHRSFIILVLLLSFVVPGAANTLARAPSTPPSDKQIPNAATLDEFLANADAPHDLPGNDEEEIELMSWEDVYGEPLDNTVGAWVLTGSPELPIASLIIFDSPEDAQTGTADYRRDNSSNVVEGLDMWSVADRGKWVCITTDGPLLIIGQAEPQPDESDEDVQDRSCEAVAATHQWVVSLSGEDAATPEAIGSPANL